MEACTMTTLKGKPATASRPPTPKHIQAVLYLHAVRCEAGNPVMEVRAAILKLPMAEKSSSLEKAVQSVAVLVSPRISQHHTLAAQGHK